MQKRIRIFMTIGQVSVALLIGCLFFLQVIRGPSYALLARDSRVRTITVSGARGRITDRYGRTLAGTSLMYEVTLSASDVAKSQLNQSIYAALIILEHANIALSCSLPIEPKGGGYAYTQADVSDFLKEQKIKTGTAAQQTVDVLFKRYAIDQIPQEQQLQVLAVRLQMNRQRYRAYKPVRLALFSDASICSQFAENSMLMPGIECSAIPMRIYPNGSLFCHGLGYLGKISADDADEYSQKGYDVYSDIVGKSGLESEFEDILHPTSGEVTVSVDSSGRRNTVLSETPAKDGQDVVLTIDSALQKVAEQALTSTMAKIRSGAYGESFPSARIGAAVAIDVSTGEVLAMASTPSYDPNAFLQTMDDKTWQAISPTYLTASGEVSRDPTLPRPLVNNAIINAFPPGSVFKPITALAALQKKVVTPGDYIFDQGRYTYFSTVDAPACWTWNDSHDTHGLVDLKRALAVSCNYYFYEMGVRTGSVDLEAMARKLGLGQKTGVDIMGESDGMLDSQTLSDASTIRKALLQMKSLLPNVDEAKATEAIRALLINPSVSRAQALFTPLGFSNAQCKSLYDTIDLWRWRPARILAAAIGQGDTSVTVMQMANAIAAITQNGLRYTPYLVLSVPGSSGITSSKVESEAFLDANDVAAVMNGMREAVLSGTAKNAFEGCTLSVGAKTGTAQSTGRDAFAWFVAYAPADKPRIAVAVMIAQGGHGSYAAPVARAILEAYFSSGEGTQTVKPAEMIP